jgi:hypothetical protein
MMFVAIPTNSDGSLLYTVVRAQTLYLLLVPVIATLFTIAPLTDELTGTIVTVCVVVLLAVAIVSILKVYEVYKVRKNMKESREVELSTQAELAMQYAQPKAEELYSSVYIKN